MELTWKTTEAIMAQIKAEAFERGIKTALYELREVYGEGIEETDIWGEYMDEEEAK